MAKMHDEQTDSTWFEEHLKTYAFRGEIPFDITFQLFGKAVKRKAKVVFAYTPEGEFYDLKTKCLETNDAYRGTYHIELLTVADRGARPRGSPRWVDMRDLIADDVVNRSVYDAILDAIEEQCRVEDLERRRVAAQNAESPAGRSRVRH
jgi:hypothetical protein